MTSVAYLYLRLTLGLLFIVAGLSKARDRLAFQSAVESFQIVSPRQAPAVAVAILTLELAGGGLLLVGVYGWLGAFLLGALLATFNVALIVNLLRGRRNLDCRCFGRRTVRIGWGHVAQNTLMLAVALLIGVAALPSNARSGWGDAATASLTILAAVYTTVLFLAAQEMANVRAGLVRMVSRIKTQ